MVALDWSKLRYDKRLHVGVSAILTEIFYLWLSITFSFYSLLPIIFAIVITLVIGIGKEVLDQIKYEGFDFMDLAADGIGILLMTLLNLIIALILGV